VQLSVVLRILTAAVLAGCSAGPAGTASAPAAPPTPGSTVGTTVGPTVEPTPSWASDLEALDHLVRTYHPGPFVVHTEAEWTATMAKIAPELAGASTNRQIALVSELAGLLDTHSCFCDIPGGWHYYGLLPYRFSDGWFIVNASDKALIGSRLVSISGVAVEDVVDRLSPLVPHDNENGLLDGLVWLITNVEYLNGAGIVANPGHPAFELKARDGKTTTIDPPSIAEAQYDLVDPGWLVGATSSVPEAVSRRRERIWTRIDKADRVFLISVNDYGDMTAAGAAMKAAFDAKTVDRVVFDMRYLPGGNGDIAIIETIRDDPRVNKPGALTVLIGRENVSAATQVVYFFDTQTDALLVGEATPARAANFTCECKDLSLPYSGFVVSVPLHWDYPGDPRPAIEPKVPMALSSVDFFAGRDPVLHAALAGFDETPGG
jgi:hypothetical protein